MSISIDSLTQIVKDIEKKTEKDVSKLDIENKKRFFVEDTGKSDGSIFFETVLSTNDVTKMLFNKQLEIETLEKRNRFTKNLYAGDVANTCIRCILFSYFGLNNIDIKLTFKSVFYKMYGNFIQTVFENLIKFTYTRVLIKHHLSDTICVSGEIDCMYVTGNKDFVLLDIKTIDDSVLTSTFNGRDSDLKQILYYTYIILAKKIANDNIEVNIPQNDLDKIDLTRFHLQLWYISRNFNIKVITWKNISTDLLLKDSIEYFRTKEQDLNKYITLKIIPSLTSRFVNKDNCHFCLYKKFCYNNTSEIEVKDKDLFVRLQTNL